VDDRYVRYLLIGIRLHSRALTYATVQHRVGIHLRTVRYRLLSVMASTDVVLHRKMGHVGLHVSESLSVYVKFLGMDNFT